jgi:hypothetical protein
MSRSLLAGAALVLGFSSGILVSTDAAAMGHRSKDIPGLNIEAFEAYLRSLPKESRAQCAKGVRLAMSALFGAQPPRRLDGDYPDAHEYSAYYMKNWRVDEPSLCYRRAILSGGTPQNFDIRVIDNEQGTGPLYQYGHIELHYKGNWYSDHRQKGSVVTGRNARYLTYRLQNCGDRDEE